MSDEELKFLDQKCDQIMEHFDSVIMFVTRHDNGITRSVSRRAGNYYANRGQVIEWLNIQSQADKNSIVND